MAVNSSYTFDPNRLVEAASPEILDSYRALTILDEIIPTKTIPEGISVDQYAVSYILETQEAAWTASGFNPNKIKLDLKDFKVCLGTFSQAMTLTEKEKAKFARTMNLMDLSYQHLGSDVAKSNNRAIFTGKDAKGNNPYITSDYQHIKAMGTNWNTNVATTVAAEIAATGTAIRPKLAAIIDGGDWSTYTNFDNNISDCIGDMVANGCNKATIVCFYPSNLESVMLHKDSQYENKPRWQSILDMGIAAVVPYDSGYATGIDGSTAATKSKFDVWFVDITKVAFLIQRDLTIDTVPTNGAPRSTDLTAELWGGMLIIPIPKLSPAGVQWFYKGVGCIAECSAS